MKDESVAIEVEWLNVNSIPFVITSFILYPFQSLVAQVKIHQGARRACRKV
jgi:hypothetical protein